MKALTKIHSFFDLLKKALTGEELNFTEGSINRAIFLLAIPMVVEMGMESIFAIVDIFFISQLGDSKAIAAVGFTENVLSILYSLAMGLSMGVTAIIARRVGEKDAHGASLTAMQAIYIALVISATLSTVGMVYHKDVLRLLGASEAVIDAGSSYTLWMFGGNYTVTLLFVINAIFRGAGNAAIAMRSLLLANVLNMMLDPILIFGWGPIPAMGVEGAAIATNLGRATGVVYQLYFLFNGKSLIKLAWANLVVKFDIITSVLSVAGGSIFQFLIGSASWIFLLSLMSRFGDEVAAGYTIAIRVFIFTLLPSWGLANAAATLVGQNLGAQQPERAEQSVWRAGFYNSFVMVACTLVLLAFAPQIIAVFTDDAVVLQSGTQALRYVSIGYVFYGYGMVMANALNGAGDTYTPTILNIFGFWVFQIPFAYLMAIHFEFGPRGVFFAIVLAETLMAIAAIIIFKRGKWKTVKV
ncbi:MAG: MATE family efflux transporter [Cyclobacteriaceae bacterium]|jgi:putative MATE family efflux protein|nr:MATE family efflux transporter [Cyclobacteriaceae bacterium]